MRSLRLRTAALDPNDPWRDDKLGRRQLADFLTTVLREQPAGCVMNVNGAWGSGKTFFLDRWVIELRRSHPVVLFNAWSWDNTGDPLATLLAETKTQLEATLPDKLSTSTTMEKVVAGSGRLLAAAAPMIARTLVRKVAGEEGVGLVNDVLSPANEEELATLLGEQAKESIEAAMQVKDAAKAFRVLFSELAKTTTVQNGMSPPLFVFIDELDRCRPTYALELLECVKHLFSTSQTVFVVATDTDQLRQSIRTIYGTGFDTGRYLRRFFDVTFHLPGNSLEGLAEQMQNAAPLGVPGQQLVPNNPQLSATWMAALATAFGLTPRDFEQCHLRTRAAAASLSKQDGLHWLHLGWLVMAEMQAPEHFRAFADRRSTGSAFLGRVVENFPECNVGAARVGAQYLGNAYATRGELGVVINRWGERPDTWDRLSLDMLVNLFEHWVDLRKYVSAVDFAGTLSTD